MKAQQFRGRYPMKHGTGVSVNLSVILYEEEQMHYAYCAALDILGYGYSEEEARHSFEVMIRETLEDAITAGNLGTLLQCYGWKEHQPPKTSDLIAHSRTLVDIVDNKTYRTIQAPVTIPCA